MCEPLKAPEGTLLDLSINTETNFVFAKEAIFTLREWALPTGGYFWDLPADHTWAKCLSPVGEAFDDGRYRQVSYKVEKCNCVDSLVRTQIAEVEGSTEIATATYTFTVWPTALPEFDGRVAFDLDTMDFAQHVEVEAGSQFFVYSNEMPHYPKGFAWNEPKDHAFTCLKVLNMNYGDLAAGYRVWMMEAPREICEEAIPLTRPEWWTEEPKAMVFNVKTKAIECADTCKLGQKRATLLDCTCVGIDTLPAVGELFYAHEQAVGSTLRVWMKMDDSVTLRQWVGVDGTFMYNIDTSQVELQCLEAVGEPYGDAFYQQVTLKAITSDCRWKYTL